MLKYIPNRDEFVGLVRLPNNKSISQQLTATWVQKNVDTTTIQIAKKKGRERERDGSPGLKSNKFVALPVGSQRDIPYRYIDIRNPIIFYQQGRLNSCAFGCFCSMLYYLGYEHEAHYMNQFKDYYYRNECDKSPDVMGRIVRFCREEKCFSSFRMKRYLWPAINQHFDILNNEFLQGEFAFINVWTHTEDVGDAVCICDRYVFDSNAGHALHLNANTLEFLGSGGPAQVKSGYYFHQRETPPFSSVRKRKKRKKDPIM
jgi:hypothetical protein